MRPDWLKPAFDAAGMGAADRWAIEQAGLPSLTLMEAAGRGLAEVASRMAGPDPVAIICGKGNNGGDGLVAARYLLEAGHEVRVFLLGPGEELSPDARANLDRLPPDATAPIDPAADEETGDRFSGPGLIIDALLGTGFSGQPRDPVADAIRAINGSDATVIACDLPSGVNGSTGEAGLAVRADITVTFHALKLGHVIVPGKQLSGPVEVIDIGIPSGAPEAGDGVIGAAVLDLLPLRGAASSKFTSGRVSIIGASRGLTGAVCLAAEAAIRAGAGYATVAVPGGLEPIFESRLTEVMSAGFGEGADRLEPTETDAILEHCENADAVLLGPGMGRDPGTGRLVRELAAGIEAPLVVDADALTLIGTGLDCLQDRSGPTILTPHPGEMGRLLGIGSDEVTASRLESARKLARDTAAVVVLKGDDTIVTDGDRVAVNGLAAAGLATAGTGDVLAGVIGALLARGVEPFAAAAAAVFGHARAGRAAAVRAGAAEGVIASDVIAALPAAMLRSDPAVE